MPIDTVEFATGLVASIRANRQERSRVLTEARATRRDSRFLRERTRETLDAHLRLGWRLWSAGLSPGPPGLIPTAWLEETEDEEQLLLTAAKSCAETYERMASLRMTAAAQANPVLKRASGLIGGSAGLAQARLGEDAWTDDTRAALALCVRVIEDNEPAFDGKLESAEAILAASAARRCMSACRRALASVHGWDGDE